MSFAYSVHTIYAQMRTIAESIDYEATLLLDNQGEFYMLNKTVTLQNIGNITSEKVSRLMSAVEKLWSDERVGDAYGVLYALPSPSENTSAAIAQQMFGLTGGILFVYSKNFTGTCVNIPLPGTDYGRFLSNLSERIGLTKACDEDTLKTITELLSRLTYFYQTTTSPAQFGTSVEITARPLTIPPDAGLAFIITSDPGVFRESLEALLRAVNASGVTFGPGVIAVAFKPEAYVNPVSAQATLDRLQVVASDIGREVNASSVSTYRAYEKLQGYQMFETTAKLMIVIGLVPPIMIVLIAANPIAESIILSMRKQVGLLRLRGAGPGMLKKEFAATTAVTGVAGFLAGAAVTYTVVATVFGDMGPVVARVTLTDPVIVAIAVVITGIVLAYTARKARKVIAEMPPTEAIKTTLTPEELLKPLKVGGLGWFSIIIGLYFVVTGYLGWSATSTLFNYIMGSGGQPNIGVFIVLVILAMIEGVLKPFAPILLAYGIAKYVAVNYDKIMEKVARSGVLGELTFVGKGLIGVMKRRVTAILVLTIFTVSVLAQTYVSTTANETLLNSAMLTSLGNEYGAYVDLMMNSSTGLSSLSKYIAGTGCGAYIALVVNIRVETESAIAVLVIVPNPDALLSNSAWFPQWSRPDPFDAALRRVSDSEVMALLKMGSLTMSTRVGLGDTVSLVSRFDNNKSINVTIAEETDGFPGYGLVRSTPYRVGSTLITRSGVSNIIVAGSPMAERLDNIGFLSSGFVIRVVALGDNNDTVSACIAGIKEEAVGLGMSPIAENYLYVGDLRLSDPFLGGSLSMAQSSLSITQAVVLIGLAVAFSVILSWSVTKEVIRVYLLLRVRGASAKDIARIGAIKWATLTVVAVALGLFVGGALGKGAVSSLGSLTSMVPLSAVTSSGSSIAINLGQGVATPYIPVEGWAIVGATAAALTLFPLAITLKVFRGAVRERFIEVR